MKQNKLPNSPSSPRRENGAGTFTNLPSGAIRFQCTAKFPNGDTIRSPNGKPIRLSGTGSTKLKAKKDYEQKLAALIDERIVSVDEAKAVGIGLATRRQMQSKQKQREEIIWRPFIELFQEWLDLYKDPHSKKVKPATYDHYGESSKRLERFFGNAPYASVDQDEMQRFANWLSTPEARQDQKPKGLSPKTIHNTFVPIKEFTKYFSKKWKLENPCEDIITPQCIDTEMRVMSEKEMDIFIREIYCERLGPAMYLSLFTGLRMGEMLALTWDDLDMKNHRVRVNKNIVRVKSHLPYGPKTVLIVQDMPKTKKSRRTVRVPSEVFQILMMHKRRLVMERYYNPDNLMFPTKFGTHTDPRTYQKRIAVIVNRCGEQGIHPHTLRHTFATRLAEQGVPLHILQRILGHASVTTTEKYSHALDEQKDSAVDVLDGRISQAYQSVSPDPGSMVG